MRKEIGKGNKKIRKEKGQGNRKGIGKEDK